MTINSIPSGEHPSLNAPVIARNDRAITIVNPAVNGGYVTAFDIFDTLSGRLLSTVYGTSYDISALPAGDYVFAAKSKGTHFEDSDYSNQIRLSIYSVSRILTDLTANNSASTIIEGQSYSVTLSPSSGKYLPEDITVTMDGAPTSDYSYNSYTGVVTVFGVTGDLIITAAAASENKLRRPTVVIRGSNVTVTPPRSAATTVIAVNGVTAYTHTGTSSATYDLSQMCTSYGIYIISAVSSATGYIDSETVSVRYTVGAEIAANNGIVSIVNIVTGIASLNLYIDGNLIDNISYDGSASWALDMSDYRNRTSDGIHKIVLEAVGTGISANRSNEVEWFNGVAPIYGVSGLFASTPTLIRTDDAVDMDYVINSSTGAVESDFNEAFPWNKTKVVYTEAGKFVSFPKMYFRIGTDNSSRITDAAVSEYPSSVGNWYQVEPFYYGCYGASTSGNRMCSKAWADRAVETRSTFRTRANRGRGYLPLDLYHRNVLMLLWLIEFATKDSSSIMTGCIAGSGIVGGESLCPLGGTESISTPSGFELCRAQMRYHYIEDFIGNVWECVDGICMHGPAGYDYVTDNPSDFSDNDNGKNPIPWETPSIGEIQAFGWDASMPFLFTPISIVTNNNYNTYFCDGVEHSSASTNCVMIVGAGYNMMIRSCGLSYMGSVSKTHSSDSLGSRLLRIV